MYVRYMKFAHKLFWLNGTADTIDPKPRKYIKRSLGIFTTTTSLYKYYKHHKYIFRIAI